MDGNPERLLRSQAPNGRLGPREADFSGLPRCPLPTLGGGPVLVGPRSGLHRALLSAFSDRGRPLGTQNTQGSTLTCGPQRTARWAPSTTSQILRQGSDTPGSATGRETGMASDMSQSKRGIDTEAGAGRPALVRRVLVKPPVVPNNHAMRLPASPGHCRL